MLSRRSDVAEGAVAEDGEGSQVAQLRLKPFGFNGSLGSLRSFTVLRRSALRAPTPPAVQDDKPSPSSSLFALPFRLMIGGS